VNPNLDEFAGKIDPASQDVAANRGITDTEGHGTATAAVAAAARNGSGIMGVAFNSTIISLNTSDPNDCDGDNGCKHSSADIAKAIDLARQAGARVINISLGGDDPSLAVNLAVSRAAAAGIVVVMSAGNSGDKPTGDNPEGFALGAAPAGNVIIAGAVDSSRTLASFSNRAGSGQAFYLAAIGSRVLAPDKTGTLFLWSGTSFSAPVISGAVALLASAFPNLTGRRSWTSCSTRPTMPARPGSIRSTATASSTSPAPSLRRGRCRCPIRKVAVDPDRRHRIGSDGRRRAAARRHGHPRRLFARLCHEPREHAPAGGPGAAAGEGLQGGLHSAAVGAGGTAVSITVQRNLMGQPNVGFAQLGLTYEDSRKAASCPASRSAG
jgi:subtilisin family serine protease